jgi:hypothetical protein
MKVSGYATTFNCIEMEYPFLACLAALRGFCDEVCVADGGSRDGTVAAIHAAFPDVRVEVFRVDFADPRWAIHLDGLKSRARAMCSGDVLWQSDVDEVVHPDEYATARDVCRIALERRTLIALPVLEFWGDLDTLRDDGEPKPRVSPDLVGIVHGIPTHQRVQDARGEVHPRPFRSDGCDYISASSGLLVPVQIRERPRVWHVSWLDLERKIRHYRSFWHRFHRSMYDLPPEDTAAHNVMFDKPWSEVTDADVAALARILATRGPRVFDRKLDTTPGRTRPRQADEPVPESILRWHAGARPG